MKKILFVLALTLVCIATFAQKPAERRALFRSWNNYEISQVKTASSGYVFVKVWGFGKKEHLAIAQAKKNAVHACIFRGLAAVGSEIGAFPALIQDQNITQEDEKADYFADFFNIGPGKEVNPPYISFVDSSTDGVPSGQDRREVKGGYKVALYVRVNTDMLRKKLQQDNIIVSLQNMF